MSLTFESTQISVWPGLLLITGWNWPFTVNCMSRLSSAKAGSAGMSRSVRPSAAVKLIRFEGMYWNAPRRLLIESGPAYQIVACFVPLRVWSKLTGASSGR